MSVDFKEYGRRMEKALEHLQEEFGAVRAGRANAKVLDRITVEYYGSETPLNGVAKKLFFRIEMVFSNSFITVSKSKTAALR